MKRMELLTLARREAHAAVDANAVLSDEAFAAMEAAHVDAGTMALSLAMTILQDAHDGLEFEEEDDREDDDDPDEGGGPFSLAPGGPAPDG